MKKFSVIWCKSLIVTSSLFSVTCLSLILYLSFTYKSKIDIIIATVVLLLFVIPILFSITSYAVDNRFLYIKRIFWSNKILLSELKEIDFIPNIFKKSTKYVGNSGIFSFTGIFQHDDIGEFRAFVTDSKNVVILSFKDKKIAISPRSSNIFIKYIKENILPNKSLEPTP